MLLVALTGGLATGKTHVGRQFVQLGCHLILADELGHQTLLPEGEAYAPAVALFGSGIVDSAGLIDRKALAAIVFSDPAKLQELNAIVHPAVGRLQDALVRGIAAQDPAAIILVEAAIHIETGGYKRYRKLILVVCSEEQQILRAMRRDHATLEEVKARLQRQMPLEAKRQFADYVIDTTGDEANTFQQVQEVYNRLRTL